MSMAREGERVGAKEVVAHVSSRKRCERKRESISRYLKISDISMSRGMKAATKTMADGLSELSAVAWITLHHHEILCQHSIHEVLFVAAFQPTLLRNGMKWFFRFQSASKQHPSPSQSIAKLYPISSPISNISTSSSSCSCSCSFSGSWWFFSSVGNLFVIAQAPSPPRGALCARVAAAAGRRQFRCSARCRRSRRSFRICVLAGEFH